jgi:hypothetical protein
MDHGFHDPMTLEGWCRGVGHAALLELSECCGFVWEPDRWRHPSDPASL